MKMSDVFKLPVMVAGNTVYDLRPSIWLGKPSLENNYFFGVQNTKTGEIEKNKTATAIAECINNHDKLVELNKELLWELKTLHETVKAILEDPEVLNVYRRHFDHRDLESTRALIVKSERLNK